MVQWRTRTVHNDGVTLVAFELGDPSRPPVVLMHGWPDTHHLWTNVAPALAEEFHVIAYDARGFGQSDRPTEVSAYRLEEMADDLYAVIDEIRPDRPVHVIGHDWGSVQAWEAVCRPDATDSIASFTSVSGPNLDHLGQLSKRLVREPTPLNLVKYLGQQLSSAYTYLFRVPVLPTVFFTLFGSPTVVRKFLRIVERTPAENVTLAPTLRYDMISGLRLYRANISEKLRRPDPKPTDVPVLEVVNRRDVALRPYIFELTPDYAAQSTRHDSPTGHWLPYSHPDYLVEVARDHIRTHEKRRGAAGSDDDREVG